MQIFFILLKKKIYSNHKNTRYFVNFAWSCEWKFLFLFPFSLSTFFQCMSLWFFSWDFLSERKKKFLYGETFKKTTNKIREMVLVFDLFNYITYFLNVYNEVQKKEEIFLKIFLLFFSFADRCGSLLLSKKNSLNFVGKKILFSWIGLNLHKQYELKITKKKTLPPL